MAEEEGKRGTLVWLISSAIAGAIVAIVGMTLAQQVQPAAIEIVPPPPTPTPAPSATPGPLRVYVTGAVNSPAVYEVPAGSIVADVVRAAGDFREDAAREHVNLALPLSDGMHVHVPALLPETDQPLVAPFSLATPSLLTEAVGGQDALVNINTAGVDELDTLPGVGPATAQNIIDHRQRHGPFTAIEEIMDVSGIGPAKFEQMKALITVE